MPQWNKLTATELSFIAKRNIATCETYVTHMNFFNLLNNIYIAYSKVQLASCTLDYAFNIYHVQYPDI